jgi:hypothetical protein
MHFYFKKKTLYIGLQQKRTLSATTSRVTFINVQEQVFLSKQYFIHIQSEWDQAAGLAYFSPLPTSLCPVANLPLKGKLWRFL